MSGVILHHAIATLHKFLDPSCNLCEDIPKHDSIFLMTSLNSPLFLLTLKLPIIYSRKQFIQFGGGAEVDASLIFFT